MKWDLESYMFCTLLSFFERMSAQNVRIPRKAFLMADSPRVYTLKSLVPHDSLTALCFRRSPFVDAFIRKLSSPPFAFPTLSYNSFCVCLSVFLSLSLHFSVSPIVEEEIEDLFSDSSDDSPKAQAPDVKMSRMFRFPSPENFHPFVEIPVSPPQAERKPPPKYVCYL